jgi:hypothetical protein
MEVSDPPEIAARESHQHHYELDSEFQRIAIMPDTELLRFGLITKFNYLRLRYSGNPRLPILRAHLIAARAEWNRRHSKLPVVDSF